MRRRLTGRNGPCDSQGAALDDEQSNAKEQTLAYESTTVAPAPSGCYFAFATLVALLALVPFASGVYVLWHVGWIDGLFGANPTWSPR